MRYLKQFLIIIAVSFLGEAMRFFIPLPISASVYGIVLMFLCLEFHIIPVSSVRETGMFLVEIMPIMFIPAAVGLIKSWDMISSSLLSFAIVTFVSTFVVMGVSGLVTQAVGKLRKGDAAK